MDRKLSEIHRYIHRTTMELAKRNRHLDGGAHARLLALAAVSRSYFASLRSIGK
jgi:hypothetical protein